MKTLVNLASVMVDKYLFFDNPVFRNFGTERPISDFQLKKSIINNVCSCTKHLILVFKITSLIKA